MSKSISVSGGVSLGLFLLRLTLGGLFFFAGLGKFIGQGLKGFVNNASGTIPSYLPELAGRAYLYALPFVELLAGLLLVLGLFTRPVATIITLMLLSFLMATMAPFDFKGGGAPFDKNFILISIAILLVSTGAGALSLDAVRAKGAASPPSAG